MNTDYMMYCLHSQVMCTTFTHMGTWCTYCLHSQVVYMYHIYPHGYMVHCSRSRHTSTTLMVMGTWCTVCILELYKRVYIYIYRCTCVQYTTAHVNAAVLQITYWSKYTTGSRASQFVSVCRSCAVVDSTYKAVYIRVNLFYLFLYPLSQNRP